jgi:fumarylacetoacetate (FAA) hydrolase
VVAVVFRPNAHSVALLQEGGDGFAGRDRLDGADLRQAGIADAGEDMTFDFGTLIAHAAKTRALGAGTIIGSGTVSNRGEDGGPGLPIARGGRGYSCLAEVRTVETILDGQAATPFLKHGDRVRIWMDDDHGHPIFGTIEQEVVAA